MPNAKETQIYGRRNFEIREGGGLYYIDICNNNLFKRISRYCIFYVPDKIKIFHWQQLHA